MLKKTLKKILGTLCLMVCFDNVYAGSATLILNAQTLNTFTDASGGYQYEGGIIYNSTGIAIGNYMAQRRTNTAVLIFQPVAMEELTLFFPGSTAIAAANSINLSGSYNTNSGNFSGGVSAASRKYNWLYGGDAKITPIDTANSTLLIRWNALNTQVIP